MNSTNERTNITLPKHTVPIKTTKRSSRTDWLVPAALLLLTFIPVAAGIARLLGLAGGAPVTPENARFVAMPLPVVIHIIGATVFSVLGAFQFSPALRRRRPAWHRVAGRILIPCGIAAALSGMWMSQFYPLTPHIQTEFLGVFRLVVGSLMALSLVLGFVFALRRDFPTHSAWVIRGYAIGQGAGTQAFVSILWLVIFGAPNEVIRDLLLIAGWLINLAVAEWIIRTKIMRQQPRNRVSSKNLPVSRPTV